MRRFILASMAALTLGVVAHFTLVHFYPRKSVYLAISDGRGDGPDYGDGEFSSYVESLIAIRSAAGGVIVAIIAFTVVFGVLRPRNANGV